MLKHMCFSIEWIPMPSTKRLSAKNLPLMWQLHEGMFFLFRKCLCWSLSDTYVIYIDEFWSLYFLTFFQCFLCRGTPRSQIYVPTCIHLFPHARTDTIQVVEHEPNFSKFYPLTISFLVSQFCTLESSLCVSSSGYYLISPFGSSLIKVILDPKIRTTECTHQTTSVHRMNSWLITM